MDRIRRALDLARLEREKSVELLRKVPAPAAPARAPAAAEFGAASTAYTPPAGFVYSRTRVYSAPPELLERNRILNPGSADPAAAAFRMLRTQVMQRMDTNAWRTWAIFSPGANDGKTTTAVNLAASLANDRSHTVLLVEFDLRRPTLAARLGLSIEVGSDDALRGQARVEDCLYHLEGFGRLVVMPARSTLHNSSEALAGPHSRDMVSELRSRYPERIVVFDLPPVLTADDALSFAPLIECGLVVAAEGHTRRSDLLRTIELLRSTPLVGTVLNRATDAPAGY